MTQLQNLASKIPSHYRREILLTNMISNAKAGDENMKYLLVIWKEYIEPNIDLTCPLCLKRVLENYKALQETFIEMEKNSNLLNQS